MLRNRSARTSIVAGREDRVEKVYIQNMEASIEEITLNSK